MRRTRHKPGGELPVIDDLDLDVDSRVAITVGSDVGSPPVLDGHWRGLRLRLLWARLS